jgi:hypothetical protein
VGNEEDEINARADPPAKPFKAIHILIRAVCLLTAGDFLLQLYQPYFNLVGHGFSGRLISAWEIMSTVLLPAVAIIVTWRARRDKGQRKAIWIDMSIVWLWFLCFWGFAFYATIRGPF